MPPRESESLDLSELMPLVTDQGTLGSSVANTMAAAIEATTGEQVLQLDDAQEALLNNEDFQASSPMEELGVHPLPLSGFEIYHAERRQDLPVEYIPGRIQGTATIERVGLHPDFQRSIDRLLDGPRLHHVDHPAPERLTREALQTLRDQIDRYPLRADRLIPQVPLQISRIVPQPLLLQSDIDRHNAASIRAAEDERIFAAMDSAAADIEANGGELIYTSLHTEYPPGSPVEVEEVPLRGRMEHVTMIDTDAGWGQPNANGDLFPASIRQDIVVLGPDTPHARPFGWVMDEHIGMAVVNPEIRGRRVTVPEFEIAPGTPSVSLSEIKSRRFDILERSIEAFDWVVLRIDPEHWLQVMRVEGDMLFVQGFDYGAFLLVGDITPVPKQDVRRVSAPVPDIWHRLLRDDELL